MTPADFRPKRITAQTMIELRQKLRAAMGWPDRRSWSADERAAVRSVYDLRADHQTGVFTAVRIGAK